MSFKWTSQERNRIQVDPGGELFSFDDASNTHGQLLPKQHVGRIKVAVRGSTSDGIVTLSVRPKKLEQNTEYRRMLDDIAETAIEAILQGFAPSTIALQHDAALDPRFSPTVRLLHARLSTSGERDLAMIINRPHTEWVDFEETQSPGKPLRGTSRNLRAVTDLDDGLEHRPDILSLASRPPPSSTDRGDPGYGTESIRILRPPADGGISPNACSSSCTRKPPRPGQ